MLCSCGCILRNLTKGSLDSGSKSDRGFDACQQGLSEESLLGPVDGHEEFAILDSLAQT